MDHASRNSMESIPVHRVAVVRPFARFLADIGAPVEREFVQAGLPYCALENVNNYIPSHRFWAFLVNVAHAEGIRDLGFRVGERFGADSPDPRMTDLLQRSPTLYRGLLAASELSNRTISHCHVGIVQPPECEYAHFYHIPSCSTDNPAIEQIGWFGLMALLDMVRVYTGPQWQPAEIGVMTHRRPCDYIREHFPRTRIRLSRAYSYIALEKALLSLPPLNHEVAMPASSPCHYEPLPDDFVGSLEQILVSYIDDNALNLERAAGLCITSKRSLQRKLRKMGTCYAEVLDNARFHAASLMLQDPGMHITDVAHRLGYSDLAHFSRAFRRIAGVTPRAYRHYHYTGH